MQITATELKKHLGKFIDMAADGEEIIVTKKGRDYIKISSARKDPIESIKSLVGIIDLDELPPIGEDPRLDRILRRGAEYENND